MLESFVEQLSVLNLQPPLLPYISNLTGTWITPDQATSPQYWADHLRHTVKFSAGIEEFLKQADFVFIEVGSGRTLSTLTKRHLEPNAKQFVFTCLRHPKEKIPDVSFLLNTLGKLWMIGVEIDWSSFYKHEQRCRVALPTYPFERQRYWIDQKSLPLTLNDNSIALNEKLDINDWFYIPSWKPSLQPNTELDQDLESQNNCWLVFVDNYQIGSELVNKLKQKDKNVIVVKIGKQFKQLSDNTYAIAAENPDDYNTLFQKLIEINQIPDGIAYLWSLNANDNQSLGEYLEFKSLLFLTQAISKHKIKTNIQLCVISNQIQKVNGTEVLSPEKATVLGLCKVIPQEYENISCRSIDVALPNPGSWKQEKLVNQW
ncbi:MAG: polyketide synthase, partial [Richelia sp. SM1_7_0]|nr:polyketide synthase [Richelia sp. SM1_7_0]